MGIYPVNLRLGGKKCIVIGGGRVAVRKVKTLLRAGAVVTVLSPKLAAELADLASAGQLVHIQDNYRSGCLGQYFLAICATDRADINRLAAAEADRLGMLVNVIDDEALSSFTVPGSVSCGDILFTVSTGGKSPALARQLRCDLAQTYGTAFAEYLQLVEKVRGELKEALPDSRRRGEFWQLAINEQIIELLKQGNIDKAEAELRNAIAGFGA